MTKRGQISLFMILGLVIVLAAVLYFFVLHNDSAKIKADIPTVTTVPQEAAPLSQYVEVCLEQAAKEAIVLVGAQGGYTHIPEGQPLVSTVLSDVASWYDKGIDARPGLETVQEQLALYVDETIDDCLGGFEGFPYPVEVLGSPNTTVAVIPDKVIFFLEYPLELQIADETLEVREYRVELAVPLEHALFIADAIADMELALPDEIDPLFLSQFTFDVSIHSYRPNEVVYVIKADEELLGFPLTFMVSSIYDFDLEPSMHVTNLAPLRAVVGHPFRYDLEAVEEGEGNYTLQAYDLPYERETGLIAFTPEPGDQGIHLHDISRTGTDASHDLLLSLEVIPAVPSDTINLTVRTGNQLIHSFADDFPEGVDALYGTTPYFNVTLGKVRYTQDATDGLHFFEVYGFKDNAYVASNAYLLEVTP